MKTSAFDFDIGSNIIPTDPIELRGSSRDSGKMVVLDRRAGTIAHKVFTDIYDYLCAGDLLVMNDSYMLSNTLSFHIGNELVRIIVCGHEPDGTSIVEVSPPLKASPGLILVAAADPALSCVLLAEYPDQLWKARFEPPERLAAALDRFGQRSDETVPLNPEHWRSRQAAYRSVYAKKPGSLEIPSAGLHYSAELLERLAEKGVEMAHVTLHVGATEILAVRHIDEEMVEDHEVRPEYFEVGAAAASQISRARAEGRRVVAVGTTVMRTLETVALREGAGDGLRPESGWTDLYIYPGFQFKVVTALLTNLHRPRSSHIVLTAAFAGRDLVMRSYAEIIDKGGYEFDMFGDSMLIV